MSAPAETTVTVNGQPCRVWRKGSGSRIGFLPGLGGALTWTPFMEALSRRAEVVVPSLPGFPGGLGHDQLDSHLDWMLAVRDLLDGAGLERADTLVGVSVGAALAADVAAMWPASVGRLVLVGPLGIYDDADPVADVWAQKPGRQPEVLCADPENYRRMAQMPNDIEPVEWEITQLRANEAAARLLWPLSDTRLARRLPRIGCPTLLVWGAEDRVVPQGYAAVFAGGIRGACETRIIPGAGHLADLDAPEALAEAVAGFTAG